MKRSTIIWGVILILIGVMILLRSFDVIWFSWWSFFKMWPFALVFIGISILPIKNVVKTILYVVTIVACVLGMVWLDKDKKPDDSGQRGWRQHWGWILNDEDIRDFKEQLRNEHEQEMRFIFESGIKKISVDAVIPAGKYIFRADQDSDILEAEFSHGEYDAVCQSASERGVFQLKPRREVSDNSKGEIKLSTQYAYTYNIKSDEGDVSLDLEKLTIDTLRIEAGENSEWDIIFSNNNPQVHLFVTSHPGVASIKIHVPEKMGCRVVTSTISEQTAWNNLPRTTDSSFQSTNFEQATSKLYITTDRLDMSLEYQ